MRIRSFIAALSLATGVFAASQAGAGLSQRPPPNGSNGFSVNGFSVNGASASGIATVAKLGAVMLQDGTFVTLK